VADSQQATKSKSKFEINIEGTDYPWNEGTITPAQIRELANLPADQPVIEVDLKSNTERTLTEDEAVEVKRGQGFGKKVRFQRG
jgi:Multiubiquitin